MSIPLRYNPVLIKVKALAKEGRIPTEDRTVVDDVFKRPMGDKTYVGDGHSSVVSFKAQVNYLRSMEQNPTRMGNAPLSDGHLTIRKSDYDLMDVKPDVGDLIIEIAGSTVLFEIIEKRPSGHLRGRSNLMMLYFDRPKEKEGRP